MDNKPVGITDRICKLNNLLMFTQPFTSEQTWAEYKARPGIKIKREADLYYDAEFVQHKSD